MQTTPNNASCLSVDIMSFHLLASVFYFVFFVLFFLSFAYNEVLHSSRHFKLNLHVLFL